MNSDKAQHILVTAPLGFGGITSMMINIQKNLDLVDNLTDDDKGFTNLIVQSSKGAKLLSEIADRYEIYPTDLMTAIKLDGVMIQHSAKSHPKRGEYYMDLDKESLKMHVQRFIPIRKQDYLIERSKGILYRMGIYKILKKII